MSKKKASQPKIKAEATAKAELIAKATYQRRHSTTEIIPPDVTRAKAGRWLDLISPITEWAGLKGDALRHQRQQLRIQQDIALERLADSVRSKMAKQRVLHPLPPKVLVPALEAASLESPDSPLIDWWADLLVSGATREPLRPYLIDLMEKLGHQEATFLDKLWKGYCKQPNFVREPRIARHTLYKRVKEDTTAIEMAKYKEDRIAIELRTKAEKETDSYLIEMKYNNETMTRNHTEGSRILIDAAKRWLEWGEEFGIAIDVAFEIAIEPRFFSASSPVTLDSEAAVDICRALKILDKYSNSAGDERIVFRYGRYDATHILIDVLQFTALGVEFMKACRPVQEG